MQNAIKLDESNIYRKLSQRDSFIVDHGVLLAFSLNVKFQCALDWDKEETGVVALLNGAIC